jgi:hypothetical protein
MISKILEQFRNEKSSGSSFSILKYSEKLLTYNFNHLFEHIYKKSSIRSQSPHFNPSRQCHLLLTTNPEPIKIDLGLQKVSWVVLSCLSLCLNLVPQGQLVPFILSNSYCLLSWSKRKTKTKDIFLLPIASLLFFIVCTNKLPLYNLIRRLTTCVHICSHLASPFPLFFPDTRSNFESDFVNSMSVN